MFVHTYPDSYAILLHVTPHSIILFLLYPIRDIIPFPEESQRFPPLAFFLPIFKEKSEDPAVPCGSFRFLG